ncbi:O-antigen ligase family protein [Labilithrix luteola]|nr:O-antigen ligase family protein [Labilithrix luteola]
MPSVDETRAITVGKWLLAFVVPASALAVGSLLSSVLAAMTVVAAISCGLLWTTPPHRTSRASRWIVVALCIFIGATLLQCIPLPATVVRVVAPANADIWDRALSPFREPGPAWHSISVAPPATRIELLRGLFYACMFLGALRIVGLEGGSTFLVRLLVASTIAVALSALAHPAVNATKVFGIYSPRDIYAYAPGHYGPLLNTNHLCAYLNIGACLALGAALSPRPSSPRALAIGAAVLLTATSVWAGSRGGTASLLLGIALTGCLAAYTRRRFSSSSVEAIMSVVVVVSAAGLVAFGLSDFAREDLASRDFSKLEMARNALRLVGLAPTVGFGRGSFETVFPVVTEGHAYVTFTHPENVVVQWCTEWGVPTAIAGSAALYAALRPRNLLHAARPEVGAWAALVAVTLHDLVDYHLEVPGIVAALCVCMALVVGSSSSTKGRSSPVVFGGALRPIAMAAAAFASCLAVVNMVNIPRVVADDRIAFSTTVLDQSLASDVYRSNLRSAMLRFPAEPFLPLMGAVRAQVTGSESVVPWIGRALERSPHLGRAHLVLARSLSARQRAQARLEYRLAVSSEPGLKDAVLAEALPLVSNFDDALELVPEGSEGSDFLEALVGRIAARLPSTVERLDRELELRDPSARGPLVRRLRAALSDAVNEHPWSDASLFHTAYEDAQRLAAKESNRCESQVLVASLRIAAGEVTPALDDLERASDGVTERTACLRTLVQLSIDNHQRRRAESGVERLQRAGCGGPADCRELYGWCAVQEERLGNNAKALSMYQRASEVAPDDDALLERIGALASKSGMSTAAIDAYAKLAKRHPSDPHWQSLMNEVSVRLNARLAEPR